MPPLNHLFRRFNRHRFYNLLNLAGYAVGFAAFICAAVYFHHETNFESFHSKAERIYRATFAFESGDGTRAHWARISFDYINELPNEIPEVETLIRFQNHERKYVRVGENKFRPTRAYVTDGQVFDVFDFELVAGNPETALTEPNAVVLAASVARRYFGNTDPIGKELFVIGDLDKKETRHVVTGVMKDLPSNTHLPVEVLFSFRNPSERRGWAYTYVLLKEGASINKVARSMRDFIAKYDTPEAVEQMSIIFQPLKDIHLHSNLAREIVPNGNIFYVRVAALAGVLILIIALINFMNLNGAMSLGKSREVGMRKIMGASRRQIITSLLTECVVYSIVAAVIGSVLAYAAFPTLQTLVPVAFVFDVYWAAAGLCGIALVCGIVTGLYPVYLLNRLKPMEVVRANKVITLKGRDDGFSIKRVVVTLQFCISIMLVASAMVAYTQFRYLSERDLGIDRELVVAIPGVPDMVKNDFAAFKNFMAQRAGIAGVTSCMEVPSREIRDMGPVLVEGVNQDAATAPQIDIQVIDPDFVDVLGLDLLAGENLPRNLVSGVGPAFTDTYTFPQYLKEQPRAYLINETAMRRLGWQSPDEAIGQRVAWSISGLELAYGPIVGVVRDYHQETLKNKVDPVIMVYEPIWTRTFLVKLRSGQVKEGLQEICDAWNTMFPLYPLEYHFLDELYDNLYRNDRMQLNLLYVFSGLAMFVAFMGLVGLIAYALKTRTREIAIRKVLGATLRDLVGMVSREYLVVLFIAGVIAVPLSVYGVNTWLSGFAYHVTVSPLTYVATLVVVALLMLGIIALQTLRGSVTNPADILRGE